MTAENCEYVRQYYGVPARIGVRVIVGGKPGIIAADRGHYIGVNFDHHKPGHISNCHPTYEVQYGEPGTIRPMTHSQRRYAEYLTEDSGLTFQEWLSEQKIRKQRV